MRRARGQDVDEPGQDSFLDIVANLVGILIILIMIVGAQAKDAMVRVQHRPEPGVSEAELEQQKNAAVAVRYELQKLLDNTQQQAIEIAYRRAERDRMLAQITLAEKTLQERTQHLSDDQQESHRLQREVAAAERQRDSLKMSLAAVVQSPPQVQVVQHHPTPLAQTVFNRELHFRLLNGRVVFVPVDELVDQFKTEAKRNVWKLRDAPAITETVGPIRDFRLQYTLVKDTEKLASRAGSVVTQEIVRLEQYVLLPVREDLGETVETALQPQSQFRSILGSFDPQGATVTVWVYPDSFAAFRQLKDELYRLGFLTAGRPLPMGQLITGSPNGTYSAAQ